MKKAFQKGQKWSEIKLGENAHQSLNKQEEATRFRVRKSILNRL